MNNTKPPDTTSPQSLLPGGLTAALFSPTSRYYGLDTGTVIVSIAIENGSKISNEQRILRYVRRRFIPPPDSYVPIQSYTVKEGVRLDNIAAQFLGDPEQFWRICDANNVLRPDDLTDAFGSKILITLPAGIPGSSNA